MKRGLGKGLDALFADNASETGQGGGVTLRLTDIEPNREQPRKQFDQDALSQLADSIRRHGILQPLVVRPIPGTGTYQLVAGERRWRAARMAGLTEAPVVIKELDDAQTMEIALIENLQREDLNPIEEAEGYQTLMETFGLTQDEASQRVGKSRPAVANALRLLNLPSSVRDLVKSGTLTSGHARALLAAGDETRMKKLAAEIVSKGMSVRSAERLVKQNDAAVVRQTGDRPEMVGVLAYEAEKSLTERLERRVKITQGKNRGIVEIDFYGDDDLRQLVKLLAGEE